VLLSWLGALRLDAPIRSDSVSLVPVYGGQSAEPLAYRTLSEALATWQVTEHAAATVPTLQLIKNGTEPVLLLNGEEVEGRLRNPVVNTSLLIGAGSAFDMRVTCVEHGRWNAKRGDFDARGGRARRLKAEHMSASFATVAAPVANQSEVWA
jgi:hypothetical protein